MWTPGRKLEEYEKEIILKELAFRNGNKTHTADALGIAIRTLHNKLIEYGVKDAKRLEHNAEIRSPLFGLDPGSIGYANAKREYERQLKESAEAGAAAAAEDLQRNSGGATGSGQPTETVRTETGVRVEQNGQTNRPEQPVPVRVGKEVQGVPPTLPTSRAPDKR